MQTNQILSASLLDLLFDNRNKDYGAYELRKNYPKQITKALFVTGTITLLIFGSLLAREPKNNKREKYVINSIDPTIIHQKIEPPKPKIEPQPIQRRTEIFVAPKIVEEVEKPMPTQEELKIADIGLEKRDGVDPDGISHPNEIDNGKGIIEDKDEEPEGPYTIVEVDAKFTGNWERFLTKNLNPEVPVENGAPAGNHTVEIQFVVDIEGNVSDIKAVTNVGYGMEQEAIRVLKKATKWEPAIQNGRKVKAYRRQRITFQVLDNN